MKLLIDSAVFIAHFNDKDIFHKNTVKLLESLLKIEELVIVVPVLVFLEVVNVLNKTIGKFDELKLFDIFKYYEVSDLDFEFAKMLIPFFKQLNLKTSDAIIVATAKLTDATLITWDEKLKKEAGKFIKTLTPTEFLREQF